MTITEGGRIVVKIVAAHNLTDEDAGPGKSDVYFKLNTTDADEQKSRTVSGKNPQFGGETFTFDVTPASSTLYIQAMDSDIGRDDKIGKAKIDISEIMNAGHLDSWYDLKGTLGLRKHGEVHIVADYISGQGQQAGQYAQGQQQMMPGKAQQQPMPGSGYASQMQSGMGGQKYNQGQTGMTGMGGEQLQSGMGGQKHNQGQTGLTGMGGQQMQPGMGGQQMQPGTGGQQMQPGTGGQQMQPGMGHQQGMMGESGHHHHLGQHAQFN